MSPIPSWWTWLAVAALLASLALVAWYVIRNIVTP
jgi:hypothetical protein